MIKMNTMNILSKYIGSLLVLSVMMVSCTKDFEEINTDPYGFTTASEGALFNRIVESLVPSGNEQMYINNEILYPQTQQAALTNQAWGNFTLGTENMWTDYYKVMPNVRELEKRFDEMPPSGELTNMKAMLKILVAYKTFKLTDIFGDIPYSQAGYGFQNLNELRPVYDSQESIYKSLLNDLKWCDENISDTTVSEEPYLTFSGFDRLFGGDILQWQKLANSLRLRYAMRMSNKEPELAGQIIREIVENQRPVYVGYSLVGYVGESACLWPANMGFRYYGIEWAFREHKNLRMGTNIWHQISQHDSLDGSGIFDPRAYIFFEGNNAQNWAPFPQIPDQATPSSGGIPYGSQRDNAGGFEVKGETCIYSPVNYFMIRDEDFMPIPMITGAEVHFIIAEAYFKGIGLPLDPVQADVEYMNGINSSVDWWMTTASNSKLPNSGLAFPDKVEIPAYLSPSSVLMVFGSWNATTDEEKLRNIYTQRWLDAFRQPWEAYSLTRRTGMTPREGEAINHFRLPYPPSEVEFNTENWSSALSNQGGGDTPEYKLWWIP